MQNERGLWVELTGVGTPIVLSHGVGGDTSVWENLAPPLATRFQVAAWDQPGHGRSESAAADTYGPRLAYESLTAVVEDAVAAGGGRVILVGHSLGGYLSARYAIDHPARVAALVLLATGPGFRSPDAMAKWNADIQRSAQKQGRPETLVGLHEDAHVIDHLGDVACPTLALVGSLDTAFIGATDYIARKVPNVERHTIDGGDHMMPLNRGAAIAALVLAFLERHDVH